MPEAVSAPVHLYETLDGLALNPALPANMVRRLLTFRYLRGGVARRPDLAEDVITEIIEVGERWLVHSLALNRNLPDRFRVRLARHADPEIRAALAARSEGASREVLELLARDPDAQARQLLAHGDQLPADLRAALAADPVSEVRAALARSWPQAPEHIRRALLTDVDDRVRAAACSAGAATLPPPGVPPDLVPALLADPSTRALAIRHSQLDHETTVELAQDPDPGVRRELAEHPQLPAELRDILGEDPDPSVRIGVFARADTPAPLRADIYAAIQANPPSDTIPDRDADEATLEREIGNYYAHLALRLLRLDWVTADPLPHVDSPYPCFRASAAASTTLPADAVTRLLNDADSAVRTTMAKHAAHLVDPATAEHIDRNYRPDKHTRWRPADDFAFPPETLRRFATDPSPRMRCLAPRDRDLPAELAAQLATDTHEMVRRAVADHPNLPTPALINLLSDDAESVAEGAGGSPYLPVDQMEWLLTLAGL